MQVCNNDAYLSVAPMEFAKVLQVVGIPQKSSEADVASLHSEGTAENNVEEGSTQLRLQAVEGRLWGNLKVVGSDLLLTQNQVKVDIESVPPSKVGEVKEFYICVNCGKVYWQGGHFLRTVKRYEQFFTK